MQRAPDGPPPSSRVSLPVLPDVLEGDGPASASAVADSAPSEPRPRTRAEVLRPLPRRARLDEDIDIREATRPYASPVEVPAVSNARVALRAARWMLALWVLGLQIFWDRLRRRTDVHHKAVRVRRMFESIGGTAIKFGQQLSVRVDLLPFEICRELGALLDSVPPFDVTYARQRLAAVSGRDDVVLDPEPIGSASIACVFRGVLPSGERVAVKVRRPGVDRKFMADIRVVDWLTRYLEVTTLVRPEFFKGLRSELREMFLDELDFRKEATFQILYRRWAKKDRLDWLVVPEVYSEFSSTDVLTTALAEGIPCNTIVEAVETKDDDALARLAAMEIDPKVLARQIIVLVCWSRYERPFFHADPHPGNILFQPGSRMVLLDFGSCGIQSRSAVDAALEMHRLMVNHDFTGAADVAVATMQPLPFIDVTDLQYRLQHNIWQFYVGAWTKDSDWYDRTSAKLWLNSVDISREMNLPINIDVLRMVRATLLYDTLACRLDGSIDLPSAFKRWRKDAAQRTRRRNRQKRDRQTPRSLQSSILSLAADSAEIVAKGGYWLRNVSRNLPVDNLPLMGKGAFFAESILRFLMTVVWLSMVIIGAVAIYFWTSHGSSGLSIRSVAIFTLTRPIYAATMLVLSALVIRSVLFRLGDKDRG
jgi:ubiquinone biosynthesis protein